MHCQVSSNATVCCQKHDIETWLVVPFGEHDGAKVRQCYTHMLNKKATCFVQAQYCALL